MQEHIVDVGHHVFPTMGTIRKVVSSQTYQELLEAIRSGTDFKVVCRNIPDGEVPSDRCVHILVCGRELGAYLHCEWDIESVQLAMMEFLNCDEETALGLAGMWAEDSKSKIPVTDDDTFMVYEADFEHVESLESIPSLVDAMISVDEIRRTSWVEFMTRLSSGTRTRNARIVAGAARLRIGLVTSGVH